MTTPNARRAFLAGLATMLAWAAGGCGWHNEPTHPGTTPTSAETPLWRDTSKSIDVSCFEFFQGSMRFNATRDQLSTQQLALLANLQTVNNVAGCVGDGMECTVAVTQADGSTTTLSSSEGDPACGQPAKVISFASFEPFQRTLTCQFAKNLTLSAVGSPPPVSADARCYNGLFTGGGGAPIAIALDVTDASSLHHLELDECDQPGRVNKMRFSVLDSDGTTSLGVSAAPVSPGVDGTCASLDLTFPHAGRFNLSVSVDAGALPAGDFFLRFY